MARKRLSHKEMKALVLKVVADCKALAEGHIRGWQPVDKNWSTIEGAVYLRLSDNAQVAVERGSLEQQIHIAISEAEYRSEQEKVNYRITEFYIEPGITGRHDNRPEFIRLQHNISLELHSFVIFKEISRLARDVEIWKRFVRLCQSHDCEICIRGLPFNPNDPAFILQLDQLASFAEFESRTTSKRIKESNHSALLTSGKFNGRYPLLGFDAVKNEQGEYTGIYKPNKKELKQVEWIMSRFMRVDRYKTLLDWCKEKNIKNKQGEDFGRTSIRTLLTNPRYVGKWYRNKHNAGKRQSKLMPYDRYTEVKLNHGCVIDEDLWKRVQSKIKNLDESRARGVKHCYPLSGLLVFNDGSGFVGSGAWGNTCKSTYYYNKANNLRVRTEIFESEVERVLHQIIENAPEVQKSIADYLARKESSIGVVERKIAEIDTRLEELSGERLELDKRLSFLLSGDNQDMAESFRDEYERQFSALKSEEQELGSGKKQLQLLQKQIMAAQDPSKNEGLECINKAIDYIRKKDLVSLKSVYRKLFQKVVVKPIGTAKVKLKFIFNNMSTPPYKGVDANCISNWMVEQIHRATKSVSNQQLSMTSGIYKTSPIIPESVIRQKYLENRLSTRAIASEFSCSKTYVRSLLLKYNIPLRQTSDYRGSRWFAYGKRRVGGKTVDHKAELRTIDTIRTMYAEGISTNAIARFLNTMKIPTKQQGKGWHNCTVAEILKREGVYVSGKVLV